eukprot:m.40420 g.40420  ORF g.40420 m.40420 type:complete len:75 (+) comp10438_c0_seq1:104-328(+)
MMMRAEQHTTWLWVLVSMYVEAGCIANKYECDGCQRRLLGQQEPQFYQTETEQIQKNTRTVARTSVASQKFSLL